jgi:cutinase
MDLKPMKRDCGSAPEVGTVALFQGVFETWRTSWRRLPPYVSMGNKTVRQIARFLGAAVLTTCAMLSACSLPRTTGSAVSIPSTASADPCPDSEVVFGRAHGTPSGIGMGSAFVDSLRSQVPGRSVEVYPVNYDAIADDFEGSVLAGAGDVGAHIKSMVANCPNTRMVLGGASEGATVIVLATDSMPPEVADHVAAVALFGTPHQQSPFARSLWSSGPLPTVGPLYAPKTIDLCNDGDPVCSDGNNSEAHNQYVENGMTNQAAAFAASRL